MPLNKKVTCPHPLSLKVAPHPPDEFVRRGDRVFYHMYM